MRLEELETQAIPGMVKRGKQLWDGNVCINFAAGFLECEFTYPVLFCLYINQRDWGNQADRLCTRRAQGNHRRRRGVADPQGGEVVQSGSLQDRGDWPWRYPLRELQAVANERSDDDDVDDVDDVKHRTTDAKRLSFTASGSYLASPILISPSYVELITASILRNILLGQQAPRPHHAHSLRLHGVTAPKSGNESPAGICHGLSPSLIRAEDAGKAYPYPGRRDCWWRSNMKEPATWRAWSR